jgi:hypothetical protein
MVYAYIANSTVLACTTLVVTKDPDYCHTWNFDSGATDYIVNNQRAFSYIRCLASSIGICLRDNKII